MPSAQNNFMLLWNILDPFSDAELKHLLDTQFEDPDQCSE
jgi:hypothetical protein